ncbi:MAG: hypothetical protein WCA60_08735 [Methanoregula sp.]
MQPSTAITVDRGCIAVSGVTFTEAGTDEVGITGSVGCSGGVEGKSSCPISTERTE